MAVDIRNSGSVPLLYEWNIKEYNPGVAVKTDVWKGNAASLLSIGLNRPKSFPLFSARMSERPKTAQIIRPKSSLTISPRPLSSKG